MNNPDKLWCECSPEEHRDVRNLERRWKRLKQSFCEGKVSVEKFNERRKKLLTELDEIEEKYND